MPLCCSASRPTSTPRRGPAADVEEHGPLTLFVSRIPWRFYGRPRLGLAPSDVGRADDVARACARASASSACARRSSGWTRRRRRSRAPRAAAGLEVLAGAAAGARRGRGRRARRRRRGVTLRMLGADDPALAAAQAASSSPSRAGCGGRGPARARPRDGSSATSASCASGSRHGLTAWRVAEARRTASLAAGSHQPVGDVSEIMGVGTLPARAPPRDRRRGHRAARGATRASAAPTLVFLSRPADDDVARALRAARLPAGRHRLLRRGRRDARGRGRRGARLAAAERARRWRCWAR